MVIKHASRKDIAALTAVETACFPPAEAATEKEFIDRVQYYGNHFWLLYEGDKLLAFVDGFVTDEPALPAVMYEDAALHNEQGDVYKRQVYPSFKHFSMRSLSVRVRCLKTVSYTHLYSPLVDNDGVCRHYGHC